MLSFASSRIWCTVAASMVVATLSSCSSDVERAARRGSTSALFGSKAKNSGDATIEKSKNSETLGGGSGANGSTEESHTAADIEGIEVKSLSAEDPVLVYSETVWPLVTEHCAGCHGQNTAPTFAAADPSAAYTAITFAKKINGETPDKSRLVLRLSVEKHNCWNECQADAKVMEDAIKAWANRTADISGSGLKIVTTTEKKLSNGITPPATIVSPPGLYAMEAEDASVSGGLIVNSVAGASGSKMLFVPNGSVVADLANNANNSTDIAIWTFNIKEAGTYSLFGRGSAPTATDNEAYVRINNGAFQAWTFPATANASTFAWGKAPTNAIRLPVGEHKVEMRRREAGLIVDAIALSTNPNFTGIDVVPPPPPLPEITFDLNEVCPGTAGATLKVSVDDYSKDAYRFVAPTVKTGDKGLHIKGINLLLNKAESPQFTTFRLIDQTIPPNTEMKLLTSAMIVIKDAGSENDNFSFRFDECKISP